MTTIDELQRLYIDEVCDVLGKGKQRLKKGKNLSRKFKRPFPRGRVYFRLQRLERIAH